MIGRSPSIAQTTKPTFFLRAPLMIDGEAGRCLPYHTAHRQSCTYTQMWSWRALLRLLLLVVVLLTIMGPLCPVMGHEQRQRHSSVSRPPSSLEFQKQSPSQLNNYAYKQNQDNGVVGEPSFTSRVGAARDIESAGSKAVSSGPLRAMEDLDNSEPTATPVFSNHYDISSNAKGLTAHPESVSSATHMSSSKQAEDVPTLRPTRAPVIPTKAPSRGPSIAPSIRPTRYVST